jgi:hypothetical protein
MRKLSRALWLALLLPLAAFAGAFLLAAIPLPPTQATGSGEAPEVLPDPVPAAASSEQVHEFCSRCHAYPPPEVFPRHIWREAVKQAYDFFRDSPLRGNFPSLESVVCYYEARAPEHLAVVRPAEARTPMPLEFQPTGYTLPGGLTYPTIANVNLVHLFNEQKLDILTCDMRNDAVLALQPYEKPPRWRILGPVKAPAHAEVVDLDGDGIKDIVVAGLGSFAPSNVKDGTVVWLRGQTDGTFEPYVLLQGVGRVADVQVADFNGDGKLDLVVAVFGWTRLGEILYLENRTSDWSHPVFVPHVLDSRHGAIHVPVCDLNKDGRPDFVALISQEHETIVAFLNEGNGRFRQETIYAAPHPAYGSSGIQLVDLNGDGKLDVLYTNGDPLDLPAVLRPYHSVQWLENRGTFPFVHHALTPMYGVMRAVAADLRGKGLQDIVAVSCLEQDRYPQRAALQLDSILLLEQTSAGCFVPHSVEKVQCNHLTCAVGDLYGDGHVHLVTGNALRGEAEPYAEAVTVWTLREKRSLTASRHGEAGSSR